MREVKQKVLAKLAEAGSLGGAAELLSHMSPVLVLGFPHGQDLHVTLGRLWELEKKREKKLDTSPVGLQYTAHSCKGDSGGLVVALCGVDGDEDEESGCVSKYYIPCHPHVGATDTPSVGHSSVAMW